MLKQEDLRQATLEQLNVVDGLPTLPDRFLKIKEKMEDRDSSLGSITKLIESDQATSVTIMKIANSSFYNPVGKPVTSLSYAISRLGRKETGNIALSMSLLYGFSIPAGITVIRRFWTHAFTAGQIARHLAVNGPYQDSVNPDTVFLASLLHDIGRAIIGISIDPSYFEKELAAFSDQELIDAERKEYGTDHAEVGSIILSKWEIPQDVCDIVANHHQTATSKPSEICQIADKLAHKYFLTTTSIEEVQLALQDTLLDELLIQAFPVDEEEVETGN